MMGANWILAAHEATCRYPTVPYSTVHESDVYHVATISENVCSIEHKLQIRTIAVQVDQCSNDIHEEPLEYS